MHVSLGSDDHAGGDREALHLYDQGIIIILEILPAKPWMGFKIHLATEKRMNDFKISRLGKDGRFSTNLLCYLFST